MSEALYKEAVPGTHAGCTKFFVPFSGRPYKPIWLQCQVVDRRAHAASNPRKRSYEARALNPLRRHSLSCSRYGPTQ